ncbi:alpha/beta fold hydrolase [Roseinatronobacter monicus]|uniref:Pimeloyl-ACP methyl ester carboxylesterase n=1 Tax=Roseinatronobacter monicus TaxID=393481 RepID=A0A543KGH0_9RHOB|nr:alpha/beta fold hydrolase [Roseinatronobacter monicus]TQM94179.1 pimeloyl-ACP methyl ester carboxylesterase [Roseinatronobacter monicus]
MALPYLRAGSGKPLVLVHGYLGGSAQWQGQLAAFAQTHDVIAPDLPGFGQATALPGPARIEDFASAVMQCIDGLAVGSFALLGHSMGGMIAQEIAAQSRDRIDALVLYGTGPLGLMPDRFEPIETSLARLEAEGVPKTADRISATWFRDGAAATGYTKTRDIARLAHPQAARHALLAMRDWDGREALTGFDMPCRILWGDQDRSYRWPQVHALWNGAPGAELAVIPGASHAAHMEKPDLFNALVQDFLRSA